MNAFEFQDILTGSTLSCEYPGMRALRVRQAEGPLQAESIFFPGCSLLNYGLPIVKTVSDMLQGGGVVGGCSLLCCGKILSYEQDGAAKRAAYEVQLRDHLRASGVKKIVAACPNCVKALRDLCAADEATSDIQVVPLPVQLAEMGYRIDAQAARQMLADELSAHAKRYGQELAEIPADELFFSPHDSCPDRDTGEFAQGMRTLVGEDIIREMAHNRKKSICCGSLVRAAGKFDAAKMQSQKRGTEAREAQAQGIVTPCMSCTYLLSVNQKSAPAFHYLELLLNWRINWLAVDEYMKLRFLFQGSWGVEDALEGEDASARSFVALDGGEGEAR